jgi:hypothetical protein
MAAKVDPAAVDELRKQTFQRKKDFATIKKQAEALEEHMENK